jgi:putative oxygen-independent coproporphyrinogen III oxidase
LLPCRPRIPDPAAPKSSPAVAFGVYVHVPFCASRCGYCDFNTYTATELGDTVRREGFHEQLIREIELTASAEPDAPGVDTIFFGGGTPTTLSPEALGEVLAAIDTQVGIRADAEITTEANPESLDERTLERLLQAGFTRLSLGMQSTAAHVLAVLDRTHDAERALQMAGLARQVGFNHVSVDLIYGTPGEREADLRASLESVLLAGVDHCSAYALTVEPGTALARRVARGELPNPDPDVAADRYQLIDEVLTAAGMPWYEISNWAKPGGECRHNLGYWQGGQWWGIGPGAHGCGAGERWWNLKHPSAYVAALAEQRLPRAGSELLGAVEQHTEVVMLGLRTREGLPVAAVAEGADLRSLSADGLVDPVALAGGRVVLTRRGRLLADTVIRALLPEPT